MLVSTSDKMFKIGSVVPGVTSYRQTDFSSLYYIVGIYLDKNIHATIFM